MSLLIGVDIGGTNTDGVLLDPNNISSESRGILSWNKSVTTPDVSDGIIQSINTLFKNSPTTKKSEIAAVTIGTTHFINAVIEQDKARLQKIAVLRICGPYAKGTPPYSDFPAGLTSIINGYTASINGGHRVDGEEIQPLDEKAILEHCKIIKEKGIKAIAIVSIFSILKNDHEVRCAKIIEDFFGDEKVNIVLSHQVSGIGYLERENASILNASIMTFASKIINSFIRATKQIGLQCPVLLTQNDGTVLTTAEAMKIPIRTFSSGATNSMRGASFLCRGDQSLANKSIAVIDVGGTTSDIGILLPSGFPRQSTAYSIVGGVRMNFSMPHVESIGLGGGSIVRIKGDELTIGPDSVGADILNRALVFGGDTTTTSDLTMAIQTENSTPDETFYQVGEPSKSHNLFPPEIKETYGKILNKKISSIIDRMRTSPDPIPVILVGGGSFIIGEKNPIDGAATILRPPFFQVANAIGAAMGKLSSSIHRIVQVDDTNQRDEIIRDLTEEVKNQLVAKGALKDSIEIIDVIYDPIPYVDKTYSFEIKVVGDVDYAIMSVAFKQNIQDLGNESEIEEVEIAKNEIIKDSAFQDEKLDKSDHHFDYEAYKPTVNKNREWIISNTDLEFLNIGTYILGCGGGGTPYPSFLETRNMLNNGDTIRVVDLKDVKNYCIGDGKIVTVGYAGSPTVANEQLPGEELVDAMNSLSSYIKQKPEAVFCLEIGGGNGFQGLYCGATSKFNIPVVDCDLMGRAYPTHWQTLPVVYTEGPFYSPSAISDGNGNDVLITNTRTDLLMEKIMRASLSEIGAHVGAVNPPMTCEDLKYKTVHNSLSLAWRIGRAVAIARQKSDIENLPKLILDSVGGDGVVGRLLFKGKIIGVEKKLFKGHVYGEVVIENNDNDKLYIPFKNENIVAKLIKKNSTTEEVICSVPDLISVCDLDTGDAVGTPDYRYGLMVFVLGFAPSNLWTDCEKGLAIGGPKGFGPAFEKIEYIPVGKYVHPISVIDEYEPKV